LRKTYQVNKNRVLWRRTS